MKSRREKKIVRIVYEGAKQARSLGRDAYQSAIYIYKKEKVLFIFANISEINALAEKYGFEFRVSDPDLADCEVRITRLENQKKLE